MKKGTVSLTHLFGIAIISGCSSNTEGSINVKFSIGNNI